MLVHTGEEHLAARENKPEKTKRVRTAEQQKVISPAVKIKKQGCNDGAQTERPPTASAASM